jgi:uncharacterized protein (TIGR03000 family)
MGCGSSTRLSGSILTLLTLAAADVFSQPAAIGGIRGPAPVAVPPIRPAAPSGVGYGGGYSPYANIFPNVFLPSPGGYGYGGYDPIVASVPSAAYLTLGNTTYTTESPSPLPVYVPRPPFAALPPPLPLTALLKVQAPADAELWLDGHKMRSTGLMRHYRTPPLDPTKEYAYEIRARWRFNDKPVEDVRHVAIRAGATILVDFTHLDPLVPRPSSPPPPAPATAPTNPAPG